VVRAALEERFDLVVRDRPAFPPNPPGERVDFEADAALLASIPSSHAKQLMRQANDGVL
jgi:hypothetical protein